MADKHDSDDESGLKNPGNVFGADVANAHYSKGEGPVSDESGGSQVPDNQAITGGTGAGGAGGSGGQGGGSQGGGGQGNLNG